MTPRRKPRWAASLRCWTSIRPCSRLPAGWSACCADACWRSCANCAIASCVLVDADGDLVLGTAAIDPADTLHATIRVRDPGFYRQVASNGSVGAGEAYMDGLWDCNDLVSLVRILVRNRDRLDAMETGFARLGGFAMRLLHALQRNTRGGSRRNIAAHYDLGNELFALFLDQNLMYSSAIFASPNESLEVAQRRKLERICRKLELSPSDHVIEIGTGWGGFALHAATHYGCRVTTTTISREQYTSALHNGCSRLASANASPCCNATTATSMAATTSWFRSR
jgi:hypothetical protein